jgi:hypothetical protein
MKKILTLAGALLLVAFSAGTASASSDGPELCYSGARSCVWFTASGDVVHVNDGNADGHSAVAQVCSPGPTSCGYAANYLWNTGGSGTTETWSYGTQIPEGATVYYRPCYGEWNGGPGGAQEPQIIDCGSGWTHGTA